MTREEIKETVELRIGPDTTMRVQGSLTSEHLQAIMYGVIIRTKSVNLNER